MAEAQQAQVAEKPKADKKPPKAPKKEIALVSVNAKALSVDVGPAVLAGLAKNYQDEQKALAALQQVEGKRYDLLAQTTAAVVKAATADESIDLTATFSGEKKQMETLNDQLMIALGLKEKKMIGDKEKLVYTKAAEKFFPKSTDKPDDPATKQKQTLRSNFVHMLKKCAQAAEAIISKEMNAQIDKATGTLKISGPAVLETFGAETVVLNEKVKHNMPNSADVVLKEKPSFTAVAAMAAQDHGAAAKVGRRGVAGAVGAAAVAADPEAALESVCKSLVGIVGKIDAKKVTERQKAALQSVLNAIDKVLS